MIMERKPLVVVPGLVRRDVIAYLQEYVDVRQWTEKTKMPREVLKEWLREADGLWSINSISVDADLVKDAPNLKVIAQASVGYDNVKIDEINIKQASRLAMKIAISNIKDSSGNKVSGDFLITDAEKVDVDIPQLNLIHGDELSYVVSCASIIAKEYRDNMFVEYEEKYPNNSTTIVFLYIIRYDGAKY